MRANHLRARQRPRVNDQPGGGGADERERVAGDQRELLAASGLHDTGVVGIEHARGLDHILDVRFVLIEHLDDVPVRRDSTH